MEFRDLKKQYTMLEKDINCAIQKVMQDANFIMGKQVEQLEEELATYVGSKNCITCANGTDALQLALMAWNIGQGDAVFVPDFTFFSSGEVVALQNATPVFVDVSEETFNIDPEALEKKIESVQKEGILTPKAIVAVDLFGRPADYKKIINIANKHHLLILEDGAQGFGGSIDGKMACGFGNIGTTSFFPAKPLGCYGDGGAIFTNDSDVAELLKSFRIHGKGNGKYDNVRVGINSRLDTLQAAILQIKLREFQERELLAVQQIAEDYSSRLKNITKVPILEKGVKSSWAQYTIILEDQKARDGLKKFLGEKQIPSMVYYPKPMHRQQAFSIHKYEEKDFTITNKLCETVLSLPMHPYMESKDIEYVCKAVIEYCSKPM